MSTTLPAASCGTHPGLGPFPGDPDNNLTISAVSVFGGIRVSWSYPTINAEAVAYVQLFRSTSSTFGTATQHASVKGDNFFDGANGLNSGTRYYYWIRTVSLNKTVGSEIGPASAIASSTVGQLIDILSGEISASMLAASLRTDIEAIPSLRAELVDEETNRLIAIDGLIAQLSALGIDITQTVAAIVTEQTLREDGQNVLAQQVQAVVASNGINFAAILTEQTARVTANTALASEITTIGVDVAGNQAAIVDEATARADADSAEATVRLTLAAIVDDNFAAFESEKTVRANADSALSQEITTLEASVENLETGADGVSAEITARIQEENIALVGVCILNNAVNDNYTNKASCEAAGGIFHPLYAIAEIIKKAEITVGEDYSRVEQHMGAYRDELDNLNAEYTVKVQTHSNGRKIVGGFGIYANGATQEVSAGFDVDTFWVGRLGDDPSTDNYPFIIKNGNVYMRNAYIENLTVDTIKIKDGAFSNTQYFRDLSPYWYHEAWSGKAEGWYAYETTTVDNPSTFLIGAYPRLGSGTVDILLDFNLHTVSKRTGTSVDASLPIDIEYVVYHPNTGYQYTNGNSYSIVDSNWHRATLGYIRCPFGHTFSGGTSHFVQKFSVTEGSYLRVRLARYGIGAFLTSYGGFDASGDFEHVVIDDQQVRASVLYK